jgi:hypothetical protein
LAAAGFARKHSNGSACSTRSLVTFRLEHFGLFVGGYSFPCCLRHQINLG